VQSIPDATSSPSIDREVPSVSHPVPFRFSFDPPSDPASVCAFIKAYPNLPGYHMWSTWNRLTTVSTYGPPGSEEDDEPDSGWNFSGLHAPSAMRDFMTACDYCLSDCSDDGYSLDDEGCGPSHECFHVDLGGHDEGNHLGMPEDDDPPGPAPRVDILRELAVVPVPAGGGGGRTHSSSKSARCRPSSTRKQSNLCSFDKTSSRSGQAEHWPEKRVIRPRTSNTVSLTMPGQGCPRPQVGSARIWLQRQYYSERCRSHPPPRGGVSRENSRISWRMPRSDGPKALPPEGKGTPEHRAATSRLMREASVHTRRTRDATSAAPGRLGNKHHRRDRRARLDEKVRRGYHPRRGGCYDSEQDRSPSPEPPGSQVFSRAIRRATFPTRFRAPTTITKYSGETRPKL
jgi:hypothetical protein